MVIFIKVVTWFAAAAVASDVIVTEMRTHHFIFPALIDIWDKRSKVSPEHEHSDLNQTPHVLENT